MKKLVWVLLPLGIIFLINSCAILGGGAVMIAAKEINASVLSDENEAFQEITGINLIVVKRGLWSMQSTYKNNMIELYYKSLLDNRLTYSLDDSRNEFVQQNIDGDLINIVINGQFQDFSEYEKAILLIASTSSLALLNDSGNNKNEVQNMFFKFIGEYDANDIPGIINAQWFKSKNILITNDSIIIG